MSSGTGTIERIPGTNTFALRTATDILPMTLPPGTLQDGDTVKYLIRNDTVILTPLTNKSLQGLQQQAADTLTVNSGATTDHALSPAATSSCLPLPQNCPTGLYRFTTTNEALEFLDQAENSPLRRNFDELIANEGVITLKVDENAIGEKFAYVFNKAESSYALSTFFASLSSPILSHVTTAPLESLLDKSGNMVFSLWNQLDQFLSNPEVLRSAANDRPASIQAPLTVQWLQTTLNSTLSLEKLLGLHPSSSSAALFKELEPLIQQLSLYTGSPVASLDTLAISAASFDATNTIENILPHAIGSLGLTLEHDLSLFNDSVAPQPLDQNLKVLLLRQQQVLADSHMTSSTELTTEPNQDAASMKADSTHPYVLLPTQLTSTLFNQVHALQVQIDTLLTNKASAAIVYQTPVADNSDITTAPALAAPANPAATKSPAIIQILNALRSTCVTLEAAAGTIPASALPTAPATTPTTENPLLASLLRFSQQQLVANLRELADLLTPPVAMMVQQQTANIDLLIKTVAALEKSLTSILSQLSTGEEHQPPALERMLNTKGHRPEETTSTHPEKMALHNHLKQSVQTALSHLESLQVLARPVATQQGTTQIFALPIKIGSEWTEVTIQLITQEKQTRKKRHGNNRFMVNLDVAPSALGTIHVGIDYQPKLCLNATLAFEDAATNRWFAQHKDALVQSLGNLGIAAPQIQCIPLKGKRRPATRDHRFNPLGTVDLTI